MTPETLARIHADAFAPERGWSAKEFLDLLNQPTVQFFCQSDAFALVRVVADEAELLTLAVAPHAQRRGLATALMHDWLTAVKAERAFLEVSEDNTAAKQLYLKHGFEVCGRRKDYYVRNGGTAVDALLMQKAIYTV